MAVTLSTGGKGVHGDLIGVDYEGFTTSVGFSEGDFRTSPAILEHWPLVPALEFVELPQPLLFRLFSFSLSSSHLFIAQDERWDQPIRKKITSVPIANPMT